MDCNCNKSLVLGNVVFIQAKAGLEKIELTKKLSDVLDVLGILRYILLIDVYVEEFLGRRPTSTATLVGSCDTCRLKNPKPRYKILEPLIPLLPVVHHQQRKQSRSYHLSETEIKLQVLQAYIEKICKQNGKDQWVLIVECSYQTRFDYIGLQLLSEKFNFLTHWVPSYGTKKGQHAKFQSVIAEILTKNTLNNRQSKNTLTKPPPPELQTLHRNMKSFEETEKHNSSRGALDSFDVALTTPPFFTNIKGTRRSGSNTSASFTSCSESSDTDSSKSDLDFGNMTLGAMLTLSKQLPPPELERYITIGEEDPDNNIHQSNPVFVVLVRDIFPGPASHISSIFKETLRRKGIKTTRLVTSTLFVQPKTIDLIKHFANCQLRSTDTELSLRRGCTSVLLHILHYKLSQEQKSKAPIVLILDLEDEKYVRIFTIHNFCIKVGLKVLVLEKRPDGTFERNFNTVYSEIKKGCLGQQKKIRKLKLPTYNLKFIKTVLSFQTFINRDNEGQPLQIHLDPKNNFNSSDLSCGVATTSTLDDLSPTVTITEVAENTVITGTTTPVASQGQRLILSTSTLSSTPEQRLATSVGNQIFKLCLPKEMSLTRMGDEASSGNHFDGKKSRFHLMEKFGVSNLNKILQNRNMKSIAVTKENEIENSNIFVSAAGIYDGQNEVDIERKDIDMSSSESVEVDENFNEALDDMNQFSNNGTITDEAVTDSKLSENIDFTGNSYKSIGTVEESKTAMNNKTPSLHFPSSAIMCCRNEDFIPSKSPSVENFQRLSLIEICRFPEKKRRKVEEVSSGESLFRGWVGVARADLNQKCELKKGIFSRFLTSVQIGVRKLFFGPKVASKTNRVKPSQLKINKK